MHQSISAGQAVSGALFPGGVYNDPMRKLFLTASFVFTAFAQTPTIDQSLSMKSVSSARISPDGRYVAYTVQQANWDENEFAQQIWIAIPATGERYQLTSCKKSSSNPK